MEYITLTLAALICYSVYSYFRRTLNIFENLGLPYLPGWPLLGYMADPIFQRKHLTEVIHEMYNVNSEAKYVGAFDFNQPVFVLRDLELIKDVGIRYFDNFLDHKPFGDEDLDPLGGGNLFNLQGDKWKEARSILSPSFTSSKMKTIMFHLMVDCAQNLVRFLKEQSDEARHMVDTRDFFSKYNNDVIASCVFGLNMDSLKNPHDEFYVLGKKASSLEGVLGLKLFGARIFPGLMKFLKIRIFSKDAADFFTDIIRSTVKMRDETGITRPDMIQLMMKARGKERKYMKMDINEMTAMAFTFFFAGSDTTACTCSMLAHELATNPDVQKKLQQEMDEVMSDCNGTPTYEAINGMLYLDAVLNETIRMHGQGFILDRVCKIPYELPPALPGLKPITLQVGMRIIIPGVAIHRDPKHYEDPNEFIPDRYYKKKASINGLSSLGFGIGPRSCIGSRFALLEMKILFFLLLAEFNLLPNSRTCVPLRYSKKCFTIQVHGGSWLAIEHRNLEKS